MPFFELWTIWGAFSPVGFQEVKARLDWMGSSGRISAHVYGSRRAYEEDLRRRAPSDTKSGMMPGEWRPAARSRSGKTSSWEANTGETWDSDPAGAEGISLSNGSIGRNTYLGVQGPPSRPSPSSGSDRAG